MRCLSYLEQYRNGVERDEVGQSRLAQLAETCHSELVGCHQHFDTEVHILTKALLDVVRVDIVQHLIEQWFAVNQYKVGSVQVMHR